MRENILAFLNWLEERGVDIYIEERWLLDEFLTEVGEAPVEKEGEKPWPRYPLFHSSKPPEKEGEDG